MARAPRRNSLADGIAALAPHEGPNQGRYPGSLLWRLSQSEKPTPMLYPASIIFVGQGQKRGFLGEDTITYDPQHYLVVLSPLPMLCETIASPAVPVLTLAMEIELGLLRELLADLDTDDEEPSGRAPRGSFRGTLTPALEDAAGRFLASLRDERTSRALGRQTLREILFHVLEGPQGGALRSVAEAHGPTSQLARVMRHIAQHYAERLPTEDLAKLAHMSVPTFHQHFKAMTATSPLQYVKGIRLTRAKQLLQAGSSAKSAAHDVGYESESQFSREFRRFFGHPPSESVLHDAVRVRAG